MLPKLLDPFISRETPCANERNTCLSSLQIPMKPIIVSTQKIVSSMLPVGVHKKREADSNWSEGPLKKRQFTRDHITITDVNRQLCRNSNKIEEHIRTLFLIQSLNKTMPFFLDTRQANPSLVNNAHTSSIHDPQHHKLDLKLMKKSYDIESTTNSSSFGSEAKKHRQESDLKSCLHVFKNEFPTENKQLSLTQDKDNLSELQCLIRENIEYFTATEQDESTYFR